MIDLWVRSQSKDRFAKVTQFDIGECGDHYAICGSAGFLGGYDTKKRCIEIIDEIENEIKKASRDYIIWVADEKNMLEETDFIEINRQLQKYCVVNVPKEVKAEFVPKGSQVIVYQMPEK